MEIPATYITFGIRSQSSLGVDRLTVSWGWLAPAPVYLNLPTAPQLAHGARTEAYPSQWWPTQDLFPPSPMRRLCVSSRLRHSCAEGAESSCCVHRVIPTKSIIRFELEQQTYADSSIYSTRLEYVDAVCVKVKRHWSATRNAPLVRLPSMLPDLPFG